MGCVLTLERMKQDASNTMCRLITASSNLGMMEYPQRDRVQSHGDVIYLNFRKRWWYLANGV